MNNEIMDNIFFISIIFYFNNELNELNKYFYKLKRKLFHIFLYK